MQPTLNRLERSSPFETVLRAVNGTGYRDFNGQRGQWNFMPQTNNTAAPGVIRTGTTRSFC
jgi:hypothetical protein